MEKEEEAAEVPHRTGGCGEADELVELQLVEEVRLEKLFAEKRQERGLDDEETLQVFFKLFDMWIQLYRLNKASEVLEDVVPVCRKRGGNLHVQGVQALAFTRWKQSEFKVALELFHEIEDLIGSSSALCENMGHTYSSIGQYKEAGEYFQRALDCVDAEQKLGKKVGDKAGTLLGLGIIEDRLGNFEKALEIVREAQRLFRDRSAGKPSSLIAKAGMSIAKILLKLAKTEQDEAKKDAMELEAIERERENIELFEITCGADSPLTASALKGLGEALMRRNEFTEAQSNFAKSYLLEASKDAFDLVAVMEIHNSLFGAHMAALNNGQALERTKFREYMPAVDVALARVGQMKQDANAGAYYKVAGELRAFAEQYAGSLKLLNDAITLFKESDEKCVAGLIQNCIDLKTFCEGQVAAAIISGTGGYPSTSQTDKPTVVSEDETLAGCKVDRGRDPEKDEDV